VDDAVGPPPPPPALPCPKTGVLAECCLNIGVESFGVELNALNRPVLPAELAADGVHPPRPSKHGKT
jgi:hypothetical protein